jgi:AcrR family transcriptional regulator
MERPCGKRELNRQRRRASIVAVATRYFLDHGYAATSMSAIADEIGGSKATLWNHFSSKEELFIAVLDELVTVFSEAIESALHDDHFTLEGLRHFCARFLEKLLQPDAVGLFRVILGDGEQFPEVNAMFYARGPAKLMPRLVSFFATRFAPDEAARLALLTIATLNGFRVHVLTRPNPIRPGELEQFVDDFIAHLRLPAYEASHEGAPG